MNARQDLIDYLVVCVNDFADMNGLSYIQGYEYLKKYAGLTYILKNYDIEHSYPIDQTMRNLMQVCRRNGGTLV